MARKGNPAWVKGVSGNPGGKPKERIDVSAGAGLSREERRDGWKNVFTGLGNVGNDKTLYNGFCLEVVPYETAQALWRGDDLGARAVETWPNEMLRRGFELEISSDDATTKQLAEKPEASGGDPAEPSLTAKAPGKAAKAKPDKRFARKDADEPKEKEETEEGDDRKRVAKHWKAIGLTPALWKALAFKRAYGGGAVLLGAVDGQALDQPLDLEKVRSFDFVTALEARELQPLLYYADPTKPKYGEPAVYMLTPNLPGAPVEKSAQLLTVRIHESRLLIFNGTQVSNQQISTTSAGWGDSIFTRIWRALSNFQMSWQAASVLLQDFSQAVYGMKGLADAIAQDRDDEIITKMQLAERMRSTARAMIIDAEDTFERKQTPVSGMPELLTLQCQRLAAAFDMPLTLLMGISPGGLNATGASDIQLFYDRVDAARTRDLLPALERVALITFHALKIKEPKAWAIKFPPLAQPTEKETAETREIQSRTDERYVNAGVLSPEEVAVSRFGGDCYSLETKVDFEARAALKPVSEGPAKTTAQVEQETKEAEEKAAQLDAVAKADPGKPAGE